MEKTFIRTITKYSIIIAIILALLLIAVGIIILLFPEMFITILTYALGGICIITGVIISGSLLAGVLKN